MATGIESGQPPFLYTDFSGGLNTYASYDLLTDNECRDCQNVQGTTAGAIVKRAGWLTGANASVQVNSVFAPTQSSQLVIYAASGLIASYISGTLSGLTAGTSAAPWEFVRGPAVGGQGPTYGMNGTDGPVYWNEAATLSGWAATDAGGTVPNGKYCIFHQNQVFAAGVGTNPARLFWSGLADPTAWNPANLNGSGFEDFDPNDGQSITGIGTVGPYVLVFKQHKTFVLVNPATAQTRQLSDSIGCAGHRTIAEGLEGTYFLTSDSQVMLTNGSTKLTAISDKIAPTLQSGVWTAATYYNRHYYLSGTIAGSPVTLDYDARLGSWWKHTVAATDWTLASDPTYGWVPIAAQASSNFISLAFQDQANWQDNGSPFTWKWVGPWQSPTFYRRRRFPTTYFRKRIRQIRFDGFGTVDVSIAKDFAPTETLIQSNVFATSTGDTFAGGGIYADADGSVFGGGATNTPARVFGQGVARAWSMVFSATSTTQDQLTSYTYVVTDRRDGLVG